MQANISPWQPGALIFIESSRNNNINITNWVLSQDEATIRNQIIWLIIH